MITGKKIATTINLKDTKPQGNKITSARQEKEVKIQPSINKLGQLKDEELKQDQYQDDISQYKIIEVEPSIQNKQQTLENNNENVNTENIQEGIQLSLISNKKQKEKQTQKKISSLTKSSVNKKSTNKLPPTVNNTKSNNLKKEKPSIPSPPPPPLIKSILKKSKSQVIKDISKQIKSPKQVKQTIDQSTTNNIHNLVQNTEPDDQSFDIQNMTQIHDQKMAINSQIICDTSPKIVSSRIKNKSYIDNPVCKLFESMALNSDIFTLTTDELIQQDYIEITYQQ